MHYINKGPIFLNVIIEVNTSISIFKKSKNINNSEGKIKTTSTHVKKWSGSLVITEISIKISYHFSSSKDIFIIILILSKVLSNGDCHILLGL